MKINIDLAPEAFGAHRQELFRNADFAVSTHRCTERGPMLTLANHRGALTVLPYQGLAIWDAEFDGYSLKSGRRSVKGAGRSALAMPRSVLPGRIRTVSRCRCNACGSNWRAMSCRCTARGAGGGVGASARRCVWRRRARSSPLRCRSPTWPSGRSRCGMCAASITIAFPMRYSARICRRRRCWGCARAGAAVLRRSVALRGSGRVLYAGAARPALCDALRHRAIQLWSSTHRRSGQPAAAGFIQPANCRPNAPEGEAEVMLGAGKRGRFA